MCVGARSPILGAVIPISFAGSVKALLRGARTLVVVAPASRLTKGRFPKKVLDKKLSDLVAELAQDASPGLRGTTARTLVPGGGRAKAQLPRWLVLGVLPDAVSRHNCPARAENIRHVLATSDLGKQGKVAVLLVLDRPDHALAAVNAVGRALPQLSHKSSQSKIKVQIAAIDATGHPVEIDTVTQSTLEKSRDAAELVDTPPTELDPETFAVRAKAMLSIRGVKVEEIVGEALLGRGLRGIHAVGRAAVSPPRMLVARYGSTKAPLHVALVGKGITFDTGGLHLKGRGMMETMKADMGGGAAVLGAFRVLVDSDCPLRLSLVLCLAENAIDARSYKPDDIITLHSGKTVEINNTDAEGRLLLSDGVSWAARELGADVIIDAATLTGAQLISTGLLHAAVITNDGDLEALAVEAGRHSGDLVHPLLFAPELFQQEFKSPIADMRNSVANRSNAQSSCAAQFVWSHIADAPGASSRRWCHIDLAGPAFPKNRATGYGVALISEIVRRLS